MASIGYITTMLADPLVRLVILTVLFTLMGVSLLWGMWDIYSRIRDFVRMVWALHGDVARFNKYLHEENAKKLARRLYGNRESTPPFFLRPSDPPPMPTLNGEDWADDDDRPSANTVVKGS